MHATIMEPIRDYAVYESIVSKGFFEAKNQYLTRRFYNETYKAFDEFIHLMERDERLNSFILNLEREFADTENKQIFCSAPAGYRDRTKREDGKDKKVYLHFCQEYFNFVQERYSQWLEAYPVMKDFFGKLEYICKVAKFILAKSIDELEWDVSGLREIIYGGRQTLTVMLRIIRYNGGSDLCTSPHYDKSGLTLVLDNDDVVNNKVILGPYMDKEKFNFSKLAAPVRQYQGDKETDGTSTLVFPGACLSQMGLALYPTPHAVLPSSGFRHSLIAFCLIPNIDAKHIETTIVYKTQLEKDLIQKKMSKLLSVM